MTKNSKHNQDERFRHMFENYEVYREENEAADSDINAVERRIV